MHEKKIKGDVGLVCVIADLTKQGWNISVPISEHQSYDLIAEKDGIIYTIQVRFTTPIGNLLKIKLSNSWSDKNGVHVNKRKVGDFDVLAAYNPNDGKCYYLKESNLGQNGRYITLRLDEKREHKQIRHFASDYKTLT